MHLHRQSQPELLGLPQNPPLPAANGRRAEYASQHTQLKVMTLSTRFGLGSLINDKISWVSTILSYATNFDREQ